MNKIYFENKPVYIMPMSHIGVFVHHALKREGIATTAFLDNDVLKQGVYYDDIEIMKPTDIAKGAIVITCSTFHKDEIKKQLLSFGDLDIVSFESFINNLENINAIEDIKEMQLNEKRLILGNVITMVKFHLRRYFLPPKLRGTLNLSVIGLTVTSACTLRCKDCCHCMQYYKQPMSLTLEEIVSGFDALMSTVDYLGCIDLVGGEPFLYKDLPEVLYLLNRHKNFGGINIITNGTVVPDKKLLESINKNDCIVLISDYGKHSIHMNEVEALLIQYSCNYTKSLFAHWNDRFKIIEGEPRCNQEIEGMYNNCDYGACDLFLMGTKAFRCPFLAHASHLKAIPFNTDNFIKLTKDSIGKETINEYVNKKHAFPGCRNCSGYYYDKFVPVAEQISEPLPYKKYNW